MDTQVIQFEHERPGPVPWRDLEVGTVVRSAQGGLYVVTRASPPPGTAPVGSSVLRAGGLSPGTSQLVEEALVTVVGRLTGLDG